VVDLISRFFLTDNEQTLFVNRMADGWPKKIGIKSTISRDLSKN